ATRPKRRVVAGLRLAAFVLTMLAIARPALRSVQHEQAEVAILVLLDDSLSMTIQDEQGKRSRWEHALRQIKACEPTGERLRQQGVEVRWFTFAEDVRPFNQAEPGAAAGKRTAIGGALRAAYEARAGDQQVRAVVVISDGGENGGVPALEEARRWRLVPAPGPTLAQRGPRAAPKPNARAIPATT